MISRVSIVADVRRMAKQLGLREGRDWAIYPLPESPDDWVEVEGAGWKTAPTGSISRAAELFADYLHNPESKEIRGGFEFQDADRSGVYFSKGDFTVRFM